MNKLTRSLTVRTMLAVTTLGASHLSQADDTEIYFSENLTNVRQNVMFVIDGSGSMRSSVGSEMRLDVMKKALTSVLQAAPDNLNVGLMNFGELGGRNSGHGVKFPVSPINDKALPIVMSKFDSSEWWRSSIPEPSSTIIVPMVSASILSMFVWVRKTQPSLTTTQTFLKVCSGRTLHSKYSKHNNKKST